MSRPPSFSLHRLDWTDADLGSIALPRQALRIVQSFGSGLARRVGDPPDQVWAVSDRGPNLKIRAMVDRYGADHLAHLRNLSGAKVMPRRDIGPRLARLHVGAGEVTLIESLPVRDRDGRPVSGLPMPGSAHSIGEPALTLGGERIDPDPSGLDSEGLVALADGGFILSEEFGPSLVRLDAEGRVLARHVPEGIALDGAAYPVHPTLPAIAARRQLNRGFEAIALSDDQKWLFVAFQSPLAHPDEAAHEGARHVRLWRVDPGSMTVVAQHLYPLDVPDTFRRDAARGTVERKDLKVSEMVALPSGALLVLERGSESTKLYRVVPGPGNALPPEHLDPETRPTVEEMSGRGDPLPALSKTLLFSSDDAPELSADLEGMALLSDRALLLVNDNDFGVEGAHTCFWRLSFEAPLLA